MLITALQNSKKEGLGGNALGSMGIYQIIGVKKTSDLLEQITWGLLILLFSLSLAHSILLKKRSGVPSISPNLERFQNQQSGPEPSQPDQATGAEQTPPSDSTSN